MSRVVSYTAGAVAGACLLAACWVGWETYGSDLGTQAAQEQLQEEFAKKTAFQPVAVDISKVAAWYGPAGALQEYAEAGADEAAQSPGARVDDPDPAPKVTKEQQKAAKKSKNKKDNVIPGWSPDPARSQADQLPAAEGKAWGRLRIPAIGVDQIVVSDTSSEALDKGPGVWRYGALPGQVGNATISGHRTSHGAPFLKLDELEYGDKIYIDAPDGTTSVYEVRGRAVVKPENVKVTRDSGGVRLTLTTCHPEHSTKYRLVVQAEMIDGQWLDKALTRDEWQLLS